ncbi:MAG: LuxR C-terminal-related transcriptional regulator [Planctomycetia bacterium]|nr:LuxR C-terminal-related transcriptional regulator [Planctomycetia bacterium]
MDTPFVFLLTKNAANLRRLRQVLETTGFSIISCCSTGALLCSCSRGNGCVVIHSTEFSPEEISKIVRELRMAGFSHAVLLAEQSPSFARARIFQKLPVCDYFQFNTSPKILQDILKNAFSWTRTQGKRHVLQFHLRQTWEELDPTLQTILRHLYQGATNRDIAEQMAVSMRVVEHRRKKLQEAFGVGTFAELIRIATEILDEEIIPPSALHQNQSVSLERFSTPL